MQTIKFTRWIPTNAEAITREGVRGVCYLYDSRSKRPAVLMYGGNRSKADHHYSYRTEQEARDAAARYLDGLAAREASKVERRTAAGRPHTLKVGQVLRCSWGYEQTNIDFYEVVELVGQHFVNIRPIAQRAVGECSGPTERVAPAVGDYTGDVMRKRATATNSVRIASYASAYPWDGEACHQTAFGYGH